MYKEIKAIPVGTKVTVTDEDGKAKKVDAREQKMTEKGLCGCILMLPCTHANAGKKMCVNVIYVHFNTFMCFDVHCYTFSYILTHFHTCCADHPDNKALRKLHVTMGHPPDFSKQRTYPDDEKAEQEGERQPPD